MSRRSQTTVGTSEVPARFCRGLGKQNWGAGRIFSTVCVSAQYGISWRPARTPTWTLRVLNNQFSVPRQQSFRLGDRCHLPQRLAAKLFSFGRQSPRWSSLNLRRRSPICSRRTRFSSIRYAMTFCWYWLIQPAIVVTTNENGSKDAHISRYYGRNSRKISTQSSQ